jgi:hypothetical protein
MVVGDPHEWLDRFITLDERLLERILRVWPVCVGLLPGQPEEDTITTNVVNLLTKDPVVRRICHWVEYQYEPFGMKPNGASYSKGSIDMAVLLDWERERYIAYECKRLNVIGKSGRSSLATPYVKEGMMRFMVEQYAEALPLGCMLGYVLDGDIAFAVGQVHAAIAAEKLSLTLLAGPTSLTPLLGTERFSTNHERTNKTSILLRHTLLPFRSPTTPATVTPA